MRKLSLLLVLLLCLSTFGFAQEVTVEEARDAIARLEALEDQMNGVSLVPSVSGNAKLTWGMDLNVEAGEVPNHGFVAAGDVDASITLVDSYDTEKGADDATVYGWIEAKNLNVVLGYYDATGGQTTPSFITNADDSDDWEYFEITAKIMMGDMAWVQIYNTVSEVKFNYASPIDRFQYIGCVSTASYVQGQVAGVTLQTKNATAVTYPGITLGVDFDPVSLELYFMSDSTNGYSLDGTCSAGAYTAASKDFDYLIGLSTEVDVDPITVSLYAITGFGHYTPVSSYFPLNFGAEIALDLALGGGLGVENTLGSDFMYDGNYFYIELKNSLDFGLSEDDDGDIASKVYFDVSFAPDVVSNSTMVAEMGNLDMEVGLSEDMDDGLVSYLEAGAYFGLHDLLASKTATPANTVASSMAFGANLGYKLVLDSEFDDEGDETVNQYVKPSVDFDYDMGQSDITDDQVASLSAALEAMFFPNTTFTLKYATDQLLENQAGFLVDPASAAGWSTSPLSPQVMDKGQITFETKISF